MGLDLSGWKQIVTFNCITAALLWIFSALWFKIDIFISSERVHAKPLEVIQFQFPKVAGRLQNKNPGQDHAWASWCLSEINGDQFLLPELLSPLMRTSSTDLGKLVMQLKKYEFSMNSALDLYCFPKFSILSLLPGCSALVPQGSSVSCAVLLKNNSRSVALLSIKKLIASLRLTQKHSFTSLWPIHRTRV